MMISWEEYNYFINCTAVQWFSQNKQNAEKVFERKMWNEISLGELDENTNKSTNFWLNVWQDWALAREYDVDGEVFNFIIC